MMEPIKVKYRSVFKYDSHQEDVYKRQGLRDAFDPKLRS